MVRALTLWLLLAVAFAVSAGGVYRWTDEQGKVHFGDAPPRDRSSEEVQLRYNEMGSVPVPEAATMQPVVVYSASWCGVCRRVKGFLQSKGVSYRDYDVETSRKGREDFRRMNGRSVPIILVGEQRMNGFNQGTLTAWLQDAGYLPKTP